MSDCTDKHFENMMHAFELGMLEEKDCRRLEIHLYECESCFEKAKKLQKAARLLRADSEVRDSLRDVEADNHSKMKKAESDVCQERTVKEWKGKNWFALAAVLIIAIAIPVFYPGIINDESAEQVQQLHLNPLRGSGESVIYLGEVGDVEIRFVVETAQPGTIVQIQLGQVDGEIIYVEDRFSDFNSAGQGTIILSLSLFKAGHYMMTISDTTGNLQQSDIQYLFRVEQ
jgi:hypothetical protein